MCMCGYSMTHGHSIQMLMLHLVAKIEDIAVIEGHVVAITAEDKKMILEDQHSTRYDDASKILGIVPKICQSGISSNLNNGIVGDNTKSENPLTTFGNSNNRLHKGTNTVYEG